MAEIFSSAGGASSGSFGIVGIAKRGVGLISPVSLKEAFGAGIVAVEVPGDLLIGDGRTWLLNPLRDSAGPVKEQLRKTVATWDEHDVTFAHKTVFPGAKKMGAGDEARVVIYPTGDDESVRIWHYLNGGTDERWAVMSDDWDSKTKKNVLEAGEGSGEAIITGKGSMMALGYTGPMEGIEARNWTDLQETWKEGQALLHTKVQAAFRKFESRRATKKKGAAQKASPGLPCEWTRSQLESSPEMYDAYIDAGGKALW